MMTEENVQSVKVRTVLERLVVKIVLPPEEFGGAIIYSEGGKLQMEAPLSVASKRLYRGERFAYFRAELDSDGILEIGDRLPPPVPVW